MTPQSRRACSLMLRIRSALAFSAVLLPFALSGCAETLTSDETKSSSTLQRDYDHTLSKAEREAAINDLQKATAKTQNAEEPPSASSADETAKKQE